jgi:F-type H+-transporting ATPase subunit gamma
VPSLKDYRTRIASVKNTRKITSAMKMVAASKLRQAQMRAEAGRPYAERIKDALARLIVAIGQRDEPLPLLDGRSKVRNVLIVAVAVDRGLAGGFNSNLVREVRRQVMAQALDNKHVTLVTVGRRGRDVLKREFPTYLKKHFTFKANYETAEELTTDLIDMYEDGKYDVAYVSYSKFKNVITQTPVTEQIIPFNVSERDVRKMQREEDAHNLYQENAQGIYSFEPSAMNLLKRLISQQIAAQLYSILLEVGAGEQAARMTAMDNASRNAGDMINGLSLQYNRARQAYITKEMTEIVSGVEASA